MESEGLGHEGKPEDEVSLVDLLAVLLRYRKIILILPAAAAALAGLYLFVVQGLVGKSPSATYLASHSAPVSPIPGELQATIGVDPVQTLNAYFVSVPVHAAAFPKHFPEALAGMDEIETTTYLKNELVAKRIKYAYDPAIRRYSLSLSDADGTKAGRYLEELWNGAAGLVKERLRDAVDSALARTEAELTLFETTRVLDRTSLEAKTKLVYSRERLRALKGDADFPFGPDAYLAVSLEKDDASGRGKTVALVYFASLFLAILLAFILNAIRGIRRDPAAMEKLREALRS
ncbi:MAG: hypothetical protein JNG85_04250 [Spirochaetaceae bacterium]|nr:hypothetical protein [Spirochaetaceae bacterium]